MATSCIDAKCSKIRISQSIADLAGISHAFPKVGNCYSPLSNCDGIMVQQLYHRTGTFLVLADEPKQRL